MPRCNMASITKTTTARRAALALTRYLASSWWYFLLFKNPFFKRNDLFKLVVSFINNLYKVYGCCNSLYHRELRGPSITKPTSIYYKNHAALLPEARICYYRNHDELRPIYYRNHVALLPEARTPITKARKPLIVWIIITRQLACNSCWL